MEFLTPGSLFLLQAADSLTPGQAKRVIETSCVPFLPPLSLPFQLRTLSASPFCLPNAGAALGFLSEVCDSYAELKQQVPLNEEDKATGKAIGRLLDSIGEAIKEQQTSQNEVAGHDGDLAAGRNALTKSRRTATSP